MLKQQSTFPYLYSLIETRERFGEFETVMETREAASSKREGGLENSRQLWKLETQPHLNLREVWRIRDSHGN